MTPTFRELAQALRVRTAIGEADIDAGALHGFKKGVEFDEATFGELATAESPDAPDAMPDIDKAVLNSTLQVALTQAAALEFATIPPYLTALWSIIDQDEPIAASIRAIVHEEMLHLALVNNLLVGVGGKPKITGDAAPVYPSKLPGGVHPDLTVALDGLTDSSLQVFLEIERPETVVPIDNQEPPVFPPEDFTLGEFYEQVRKAGHILKPTFDTERQIAGPLAPMVIDDLKKMDAAIDLIRVQGEGSHGIPYDTKPGDLAHYYRFKEIELRRRLIWDKKIRQLRTGPAIDPVMVYPVAPPPSGGYGTSYPRQIQKLAAKFNHEYSRMLDSLEAAWGTGGHAALLHAIEAMFGLRPIGQEMIRTPGPDGRGHAPEFTYVAP